MLINSKICDKCKIEQDIEHFYILRQKETKLKRHNICKKCLSDKYKKRRMEKGLYSERYLRFKKCEGKGTKICSKCDEEKVINEFKKCKSGRYGVSSICKKCMNAKERLRRQRSDIKEKLKKYNQEYSAKNRKIINHRRSIWRKNNKELSRLSYRRSHIKQRENRKNNSSARLRRNLSARLNIALKTIGHNKTRKTIELLGCDMPFFKQYIESQFDEYMNWNNYGSYWHADHKLACALFDLTDIEQQKICFHYSNLRPLEGGENIRKLAKLYIESFDRENIKQYFNFKELILEIK